MHKGQWFSHGIGIVVAVAMLGAQSASAGTAGSLSAVYNNNTLTVSWSFSQPDCIAPGPHPAPDTTLTWTVTLKNRLTGEKQHATTNAFCGCSNPTCGSPSRAVTFAGVPADTPFKIVLRSAHQDGTEHVAGKTFICTGTCDPAFLSDDGDDE
jgi:hypothetical protein